MTNHCLSKELVNENVYIIKQLLISVLVICQIIKVSVKPVFHLRIFSREAIISFVFIQLVPDGFS